MPTDDTEDDDLYSRFTVSGFGPVVHEGEQDGVTIATKTQGQVERSVRDADDFSDVLGGRNPDHDLASVRALIGDAENLRLPKGKPDRWEMASDWEITVEGPIDPNPTDAELRGHVDAMVVETLQDAPGRPDVSDVRSYLSRKAKRYERDSASA